MVVCVCVCVRERERESSDKPWKGGKKHERNLFFHFLGEIKVGYLGVSFSFDSSSSRQGQKIASLFQLSRVLRLNQSKKNEARNENDK